MNKFRLLRADEIECRVSTINEKGLTLLLYKDARCDMNILDETVGPMDWTREHTLIDGQLFCRVGIREREENYVGAFVWKEDVGTESYTEKEKGRASDSFKRACFNWGIGRELYTAPFIWIPASEYNGKQDPKTNRFSTYDRFKVVQIGYDGRKIDSLAIINERTGRTVYELTPTSGTIEPKKAATLRNLCKNHNMPEEVLAARYGKKTIEELTVANWVDFGKTGSAFVEAWDAEHKSDN